MTAAYFKANPGDRLAGKVDLDRNPVIAITLDARSGDLSRYDFVQSVTLRNDRGQQVAPLRWIATADAAHHRAGGLLFPKADQTTKANVVVRPREAADQTSPRTHGGQA